MGSGEGLLALGSGALLQSLLFSPKPQQDNVKINATSSSSQREKKRRKMCSRKERSQNCFMVAELFRVGSPLAAPEESAGLKVKPGWHRRTGLST